MAGDVAQRVKGLAVLCGMLLSAGAWAGWTGVRVCHIEKNRAVIFAGTQKFLLEHHVGWALQDPSQEKAFARMQKARELPADPGDLIEEAPADNVVEVVGRLGFTETALPSTVKLIMSAHGTTHEASLHRSDRGLLAPDETASAQIASFCKDIKYPPPAMLEAISGDRDGSLSAAAEWSKVLGNSNSDREQFFLSPAKGVLWVMPVARFHNLSRPVQPSSGSPAKRKSGGQAGDPPALWLPFAVIGGVVVAGLIAVVAIRWRRTGGFYFWVSGHERELLQKVRDDVEGGRFGGPDPEGKVVGRMLEAYQGYDRSMTELDKLRDVRQFQLEYEEFQRKYDAAVAEVERQNGHARTLLAQLQAEHAALEALKSELQKANNDNETLCSTMAEANKLLDDFGGWCGKLNDQIRTIAANESHE